MIRWLRGLWAFYLEYTKTGLHTATAAAFAIFALLVFVDSLFAVLAIGVYVVPPVAIYAFGVQETSAEGQTTADRDAGVAVDDRRGYSRSDGETNPDIDSRNANSTVGSESDILEANSDLDADTDYGGTDTDSDNDGTDTDCDTSDTDSDSDSDDGDTDSDN